MEALRGPLISICVGVIGGALAAWLGLPLPWMFGALVANAVLVQLRPREDAEYYKTPRPLLTAMIAVIGVMIGGAFTPELAKSMVTWWPSMLAVVAFCFVGQFGAFVIYNRVFGYDVPTSFFAASPGGLIENIAMGTEAGGDALALTLLQFLRLVLIVVALPLGFSIYLGVAVGSAAGESFGAAAELATLRDYGMMIGAAVLGYAVATWARVPVGMVIGPMIASAILHLTGVLSAHPHPVFLNAGMLVFGCSLGVRFAGLHLSDIVSALRSIGVVVCWLMALAVLIAVLLSAFSGLGVDAYILSFAPAGVVEMSLVALSVGVNPVFVTSHHVVRILVTVLVMPVIYHRWIAPHRAA